MSSIFSPVSAASPSVLSEPECEPSPSAKSIPTASASCESTGQMSLFTTTCEPLPQRALWPTPRTTDANAGRGAVQIGRGWYRPSKHLEAGKLVGQANLADAVLISSAAAFPVRTSPSQARAQAWRASAAAYGRSTPELLARFDPNTSSWKTSQLCLDGDYSLFSETLPRSGMWANGTLYQLRPLVPLTGATGSGLWRTPDASITTGGAANAEDRKRQGHAIGLHDQVNTPSMWPTPTIDGNYNRKGSSETSGDGLATAVGGALNPTFVEWMMGLPRDWTEV
jgi:hypothetical protein